MNISTKLGVLLGKTATELALKHVLQELFEDGIIYQNKRVGRDEIEKELNSLLQHYREESKDPSIPTSKEILDQHEKNIYCLPLCLGGTKEEWLAPHIHPISIPCEVCNKQETQTFYLNRTTNIDTDESGSSSHSVTFSCGKCRGSLITFLLGKRTKIDGIALQIGGVTPPRSIKKEKRAPKPIQGIIERADIASKGGDPNAAAHHLRAAIEHHMRGAAAPTTTRPTGEELAEAYTAMLPNDIRDAAPSFKKIYSELSAAMHNWNADQELIKKQRELIMTHFEWVSLKTRK